MLKFQDLFRSKERLFADSCQLIAFSLKWEAWSGKLEVFWMYTKNNWLEIPILEIPNSITIWKHYRRLLRPLDLAGEYQKGETSVKKLELFEPASLRAGEFLSFRKRAYFDRRKSQVLIFCFFFIKEKERELALF